MDMSAPTPSRLRDALRLRDVRPEDVEAIIALAQVAFADEHRAEGLTPDGFAQQVRTMSRGRFIPITLLMRLGGLRWGIIVAEHAGKVVGCGAYSGRPGRVYLHTNMVAPDYRRQGVTSAIMQYGWPRLVQMGVRWATATVLATNVASRDNLLKHGFTPFYQVVRYEKALDQATAVGTPLDVAPVTSADGAAIVALRDATAGVGNEWLPLLGNAADNYLIHPARRMMARMSGQRETAWRFAHDGEQVGFLAVATGRASSKGTIDTPLVASRHLHYLPAMVAHAESWLVAQGKHHSRLTAPAANSAMAAILEGCGYQPQQRWLMFARPVTAATTGAGP